jgi:ABC-type nitrate/sulfonate/bicarbonate transport system substrate-binding protein
MIAVSRVGIHLEPIGGCGRQQKRRSGEEIMRRFGMVALTVSGLLAAPVAAFAQAAPKDITLNIVETTPSLSDLPMVAIQELAPQYHMKITTTQVQGGGQSGQVFAGGQGDLLIVGIDTPVALMQKGIVDLKIIGAMVRGEQFSLVVPSDSPIKTLADLHGKDVGVTGPGALSELGLIWGLKKAGMNPDKDVSRIALGSLQGLTAGLENQRIAAAMLSDPVLLQGVSAKKFRVIGDWADLPYPGDVFVVRSKDLQTRRDDFVRFHALFVEAMRRMQDPAYAFKIARIRYAQGFTDDDLKMEITEQMKSIWTTDGLMTEALYQSAHDIWLGSGRFEAKDIPPYASFVDNLGPAK